MIEAQMSIPLLFICPISLDLFEDPVTLCTGQTYDRSSIEKWISDGNLTCPVTMQKLHDLSMVPNHTLRHLINEWLHMGNQFDHRRFTCADDSLASLQPILQSDDVTLEKKLQALEKIQNLSEESTSRNCYLLRLGILPLLLELVFAKVEAKMSQESIKFAEEALSSIVKLLKLGENECLNILKEESKMESFKTLLEHGNSQIKEGLCCLIEVISSSLETRELCLMLCENRRFLHSLILLVEETCVCGVAEAGVKAISSLCLESNRENLVREGAVNVLLSYISNAERRERKLAPKAMATIEVLIGSESGKEAVINSANGVEAIVKMVFRVSDDHQGSESAVRSLMMLCNDSLKATEEAIHAGVLTQLLLLLQSQCSSRAKTKARMLLKLLRSKWNEEQN